MEKAARIIERTVLGRQTAAPSTALAITQALADAGLLAPDLPEHDVISANGTPVWRADRTLMTTAVENKVNMWIPEVIEIVYTPDEARQQAHMLLAAANHAEQERA